MFFAQGVQKGILQHLSFGCHSFLTPIIFVEDFFIKRKKVADCSPLRRLFPIFLRKLWIGKNFFMIQVKFVKGAGNVKFAGRRVGQAGHLPQTGGRPV
ncbi:MULTISPECIES: hypothetical protein [Eikenella]|uniref:hypothetical protein n=1 Tax=Eikenella TaxID=538 RepID=UPI0015D02E02|nr:MULTISPECIES: hypothetical protein [Eikenella]